jgi:L-arabinose isomerase
MGMASCDLTYNVYNQGLLAILAGPKSFMNEWAQQGPAHHMAIGIGHFAETLSHIADLLEIDSIQVC